MDTSLVLKRPPFLNEDDLISIYLSMVHIHYRRQNLHFGRLRCITAQPLLNDVVFDTTIRHCLLTYLLFNRVVMLEGAYYLYIICLSLLLTLSSC